MRNEIMPLALDDLVHMMSFSPGPPLATLNDSQLPLRPKSAPPETKNSWDIEGMHTTITDPQGVGEDESADMTNAVRPDQEQLIRQAKIISSLVEQRDMLVRQAEEQRLRWTAEKDGWSRMAEALIAQQAKYRGSADKDDGLERQLTLTDADNRSLRQRLHETQSRLSILEGEFSRLRPLLLMQPLALNAPAALAQVPRARHRQRRRDTNARAFTTEDEDPCPESGDDHPADPDDAHISEAQTTPKQKFRAGAAILPHYKHRRIEQRAPRVLTADARIEHLLLAARRIGRQRTGIMAGLMQILDRRWEESTNAGTPKTPKRTAAVAPGPGYVYLNGPVRPGAVPVPVPAYPHHLLQTPSSSQTAAVASSSAHRQKHQQRAHNDNQRTPLDSLLSAARSMMDEEEEEDTVTSARRSRSSDMPDSPVPKRRKIVARNKFNSLGDQTRDQGATQQSSSSAPADSNLTAAVGRVRSGLDVLADQAAAFSSQDQQSHVEPTSLARGKGKQKAPVPLDLSQPESRLREKIQSKRKQPSTDVAPQTFRSHRSSPLPRANAITDWGAGPPNLRPVRWTEEPAQVSPQNHDRSDEITSSPVPQQLTRTTSPASSVRQEPADQVTCDPPRSAAPPPAEPLPAPNVEAPSSQSTFVDPFLVPPTTPHECCAPTEAVAPSSALHQRAFTNPTISSWGETPSDFHAHLRHETVPASASAGNADSDNTVAGVNVEKRTGSLAILKNKEVTRVTGQGAAKRQRSPYVKWSKEEDDLLSQAVAKYGQKWDLVQKALPSRGYHQVRQRWLRKLDALGVFDSKPDLSAFHTAGFASGLRLGETPGSPTPAEPPPNPKLGLAPLSSELAFSTFSSGRGEIRPS